MKYHLFLLFLAIVFVIFTAGCIVEDEDKSKPVYTIGIDAAMSPWEFVDAKGNPQGINVELIELIAEEEDFEVEYYVPENAEWLKALNDEKMDTMGSIVITPERLEKYMFVEYPFEPTRYIVITRTDSDITLEDVMAGDVSIAVAANTVYEEWLKAHFAEDYDKMVEEGKIVIKVTADELASSVLTYEADTAIAGMMTLGSQLNIYHNLKFIGFVGEPKKIGYILRKDESDLYTKLTEGFKKIQGTDEFNSLIKKYNLQYLKDKYIVGIDEYNKPWTYIDANGKYVGFDIEMMEWIADYCDIDIEYVKSNWKNNINQILVGDIDMWVSSTAITEARKNLVAFSDPYYISGIGAAVIYDSDLTKTDLDTNSASITTIYGTTYQTWLENYLGSNKYNSKLREGSITLVDDGNQMLNRLASGESEFVISGETQIETNDDLEMVYLEKNIEKYAIVMSNVNFVLQDIINEAINEFINSGKAAELKNKYEL